MRDRSLPADESSFYQRLREETLSSVYWERLELKTDSGFPDTHFVLRRSDSIAEGTCELKFQRTGTELPNLRALMESTQQPNFLDYFEAGGRRRFLLCCNRAGRVHLYRTSDVCDVLRNRPGAGPHATLNLGTEKLPCIALSLSSYLE